MATLDPRLNAYRPDLAAASLRGKVEATRFVEGATYEIVHGEAPLRRRPAHDAPLDTEALYGERIDIYDIDDEGWAWGQLETDGYVGYVPAAALIQPGAAATHRVAVPRTHGFPGPDIKLPPFMALPFGARVAVAREERGFAVTAAGFYLPPRHLAALSACESDPVAVAERFLGTPYLWGGKTSLGIDCSGLVQVALQACGITCPRDSDMQFAALGKSSAAGTIKRGDLMFWKGHVAMARDERTLIHANAHHMMVAAEPIGEAMARIKAAGSEPLDVKRL
jgi:cell wall-associated NlpC family hydrolase